MAYRTRWSDERVDNIMGNLLRIGVLSAALVVAVGAVLYLVHYGNMPFGSVGADGAARRIIRLGLLILIATPTARVVFALIAFAVQRDRAYVIIAAIVLSVLIFSFTGGLAAV